MLTFLFLAAVSSLAPAVWPVAPAPVTAHDRCVPACVRAPDWSFSVLSSPADFPGVHCAALDTVAPTGEKHIRYNRFFFFFQVIPTSLFKEIINTLAV